MKEDNEIDKFFTETVDSYEVNPSDNVWTSLDQQLDKKAAAKYRSVIFRLSAYLTAIIILFAGFIVYHYTNNNNKLSIERILKSNSKIETLVLNNRQSNPAEQMSIVNTNVKTRSAPGNIVYGNSTSVSNKENQISLNVASNIKSTVSKTKYQSNFINSLDTEKTQDVASNDLLVINSKQKNDAIITENTKNNEAHEVNESDLILQSNGSENSNSLNVSNTESILMQKTDTTTTALFPPTEKTEPENKSISKFSVLAYFSPDLNYKFFKSKPAPANTSSNSSNNNNNGNNNNSNNDENDDEAENYNSTEESKFSFNSGVLIGCDLNKKWSIKTGVAYSYLAQTIKPKTAIAKTNKNGETDYQFNTSYGTAVVPSDAIAKPNAGDSLLISTKSNQLIQIINIPVILKYQIIKNKFTFYSQIGLSANFILSQKLSIDYLGKEKIISEVKGLKKFYPGVILGFGVSYAIANKMQLFLEPGFRGALTPINKYNSKKAYPYSVGFAIGLSYKL